MKDALENWQDMQQLLGERIDEYPGEFNRYMIALTTQSVDANIPECNMHNKQSFAVIICNENYQDVATVENALNDGEVFAEYCKKTLGIPNENIHIRKDATLNNIKKEIAWLSQISTTFDGNVKILFFYAGHGISDEMSKAAYILPVDGSGTDVSTTGYSLNELYTSLSHLSSKQTIVFLDACFSGSKRGNGMLVAARGVAIKAKNDVPTGKMVVFSAAQGDETAYPYMEMGHGLFTYYLLKKLQETKGEVTLGELDKYISTEVRQRSIVVNNKSQTPVTSVSTTLGDEWKKWTLR